MEINKALAKVCKKIVVVTITIAIIITTTIITILK